MVSVGAKAVSSMFITDAVAGGVAGTIRNVKQGVRDYRDIRNGEYTGVVRKGLRGA